MFEDKWVADGDLFAYFVIHGIDVGLINTHTLLGQRRRVVDGNVV